MRTPRDCGVVVEANACGITYEDAARGFDPLNGDFRDDLNDSPLHHKYFLWRMGMPSRIVTDHQILAGECALIKTCILVHDPAAPTTRQHWVNLLAVRKDTIDLWWNAPGQPVRTISHDTFRRWYRLGSFNHAHEVGVWKVRKPNWLERFYVWFTNLIG